jgi:magnesium transporter
MADDAIQVITSEETLGEIEKLIEEGRLDEALAQLAELHPADQAAILAELDPAFRSQIVPRIPHEAMAEIVGYIEQDNRADLIRDLEPAAIGAILDATDRDVAADVLHVLDPEQARAVLAAMRTAAEVTPLLPHPDQTAGGRMTTGFVALNRLWKVEEALSYLRRIRPAAEQVFYLYAVDNEGRLEGVVSLRQLVVADASERIGDLMEPDVVSARTSEDQEEVARRIAHYNFVALPVVDDSGRLVGVVSIDDLMDVAEEEATEDMYRMVGLEAQETVLSPVGVALRRRVPWLVVNLLTAFLAALTVSPFQHTISQVALLAVFMPVVAGHGGNTGTQVTTLVVRGLALDEVRVSDALRVIRKELAFGMVHGALAGLLSAGLAVLLGGNGWLGLVVFIAMMGNVIIAGVVGSLIPLLLRTVRIDPALAAAIWLTTFTDVMGFVLLLGLGALLLSRLT